MRSSTLTAAIAAVVVATGSGAAMAQQTGPCAKQVDAALRPYGLSVGQLQDVVWESELYDNSKSPQMGGFHLEARPAACPSARVVMELWRSCQVSSVDLQGGCPEKQATR